ncbi:MAG: hypothetical protein HYV09_00775 [Deltaproteobacteria bacterium]|nr:hypothetical protein [Deltaproteobacteria bacterium]
MRSSSWFAWLSIALALAICGGCRSEKQPPAGGSSADSSAPAPAVVDKDACPESFGALAAADANGERTCRCPAGDAKGTVWGSGIYTLASSVCAAARHTGAVGREGGMVTLLFSPGCASYPGSTSNGVAALAAQATERSFYFPSVSNGKCPPPLPSGPCPKTFKDLADRKLATELACVCDAALATGPVYGAGNYAEQSSICAAAVHAGVIPPNGGSVTLRGAPGCGAYEGSTKNGVTSVKQGAAPLGFRFPAAGGTDACETR